VPDNQGSLETLMKPRLPRLLAVLILAGATALPAAAQQIRPGLWEVTSRADSEDGRLQSAMTMLQNRLRTMDPAQRAQLQAEMEKRGVSLTGEGTLRTQMCVTRDMAERFELQVRSKGTCTYRRSPPAGGKMKFSFTCADPDSKGEGEVTFNSDTDYRIKMTASNGVLEVATDNNARWLGADCGAIEPVAAR